MNPRKTGNRKFVRLPKFPIYIVWWGTKKKKKKKRKKNRSIWIKLSHTELNSQFCKFWSVPSKKFKIYHLWRVLSRIAPKCIKIIDCRLPLLGPAKNSSLELSSRESRSAPGRDCTVDAVRPPIQNGEANPVLWGYAVSCQRTMPLLNFRNSFAKTSWCFAVPLRASAIPSQFTVIN